LGVSYNPKIITDGLVFCVDAANKRSYPGSGATWTELKNSSIGTLTNGPIYDNDNAGSIVFDGTDDYISLTNDISSVTLDNGFTISFWFKPRIEARGRYILSVENAASESVIRVYQAPEAAGYISANSYGINSYFALSEGGPGTSWPVGAWYHCTYVHRGTTSSSDLDWYFNGVETLKMGWAYRFRYTLGTVSHKSLDGGIYLGWGAFSPGGSGTRYYDGSLSSLSLYDRPLKDEEIVQNYNATKGRYE